MHKRKLNELFKQNVFGNYADSYYGMLQAHNPALQTPPVLSGLIDTTCYNRIPKLYEQLFDWIDEINAKSNSSDVPLEIVLIGVGNNAYHPRDLWKIYNYTSPQVVETVAALSAIKNRKINLTLIDRNKSSLEIARNLDCYDVNPYFEKTGEDKIKLSPRLKARFEDICIPDTGNKSIYTIDKSKLKHIKINIFQGDIAEINFPPRGADILVSTYTIQYVEEQNKRRHVLNGLTHALKPQGKMITTDGYCHCERVFYAVTTLPDAKQCEKETIYLNFDDKIHTIHYCFFSEKESRVINGYVQLRSDHYSTLQKSLQINLNKNPQDFALYDIDKLFKLIDYRKHDPFIAKKRFADYYFTNDEKGNHRLHVTNSIRFFTSTLKPNTTMKFIDRYIEDKNQPLHETTAIKMHQYGRFSEY